MTAIVRIEKPDTCSHCPFCYDDMYCCVNNDITMGGDYMDKVHSDCPLIDDEDSWESVSK